MQNLEEPNYTRPENVKWFQVPKELLTGDSQEILQRRKNNKSFL
jgi:tRNA G37 N-methylase TrmD